jgi:hypothetical protein
VDDIEAPDIGEQEEENSAPVRSESGMDRITPNLNIEETSRTKEKDKFQSEIEIFRG